MLTSAKQGPEASPQVNSILKIPPRCKKNITYQGIDDETSEENSSVVLAPEINLHPVNNRFISANGRGPLGPWFLSHGLSGRGAKFMTDLCSVLAFSLAPLPYPRVFFPLDLLPFSLTINIACFVGIYVSLFSSNTFWH